MFRKSLLLAKALTLPRTPCMLLRNYSLYEPDYLDVSAPADPPTNTGHRLHRDHP